jgi:hypothetical protein
MTLIDTHTVAGEEIGKVLMSPGTIEEDPCL